MKRTFTILACSLIICIDAGDSCSRFHENCESCLSGGPSCAWCTSIHGSNWTFGRCDRHDRIIEKCPTQNIVYTRSSVKHSKKYTPNDGSAIKIEPAKVIVKLRPNDPVTLNVSFKQISDYPVDLYFLMDLSNSMIDDKHRLSQLVKQLANEMRNITSDFRLGFGSFVEKPIMPFVSVGSGERVEKSCSLAGQNDSAAKCILAYSFKHHLSLTDDSEEFASQVENTQVSRNIDEPEGGLEALMQVIVCEEIIGWRENSRRLVVLSTDAGLHFAGDGKLAGLIEPNDEKCHLKRVYDKHFDRFIHEYTESTRMDYPSFGQIYSKLIEHNTNVIFAVTKRQIPLYTEISKFLEAAVVGELDDDSSNIVDLVAMNYRKITNRMRLMIKSDRDEDKIVKDGKVFSIGEKLKISLDPECRPSKSGEEIEDRRCEIGLGEEITVSVTVNSQKCLEDQLITLYPYGMKNGGFKMQIESLCKCDCDKPDQSDVIFCNGHGRFECGICECGTGYFGRNCECNGENGSDDALLQRCKRPNGNVICSGRGQCVCGKCDCFEREGEKISGEFCECDNFSCPRWNGEICSNHGTCQCDGSCKCELGWTGEDCSCTSDTGMCVANSSGLICNGKGICECGSCICNPSEDFLGSTCEECPTCERGCLDTRDCVMCMAFKSGQMTKSQCSKCPYKIEMTDDLSVEQRSPANNRRFCQFQDRDGCTFFYSYMYADNGDIVIKVKKEKSCPLPIPFWLFSTVISSSVLIVGVVALATWRITVTIHDRHEIAEFDKESDRSKWQAEGSNPIYRQASVTYGNPLYRKRANKQVE